MILIASKNIKGITVEISGDVTGLDKALSSVDKKSKDLGSELKQVNRLLKLDPNNVVLAAQKQKILADQVENTKAKLRQLESVQDQIERQYASGQIDDGAYKEFRREVEYTEAELTSLEIKLNDAKEKTKKFGDSVDKAGSNAKKAQKPISNLGQTIKNALTIGAAISVIKDLVSYIGSLIDSGRELNVDLSRFEQNVSNSNNSMDAMENHLRDITVLTGETDSSIEALSNLMAIGFNDAQMQQAVEGLSGAIVKFPDTLKIESLSDSLQETIATGKGVGQFSELIERSGLNLEEFNEEMAKGKTVADKQRIALKWLANTGLSKVSKEYKKSNESLLEYNEAAYDAQLASAELEEALRPFLTLGAKAITGFVNTITTAIGTVVDFSSSLLGLGNDASELEKEINSMSEAWEGLTENAESSMQSIAMEETEIEYLIAALDRLVNENGKVIGSKDELKATISRLKEYGFDIEYDAIENQIKGYQNLREEVEAYYTTMKYNSRMEVMEPLYWDAKENEASSYQNYAKALAEFNAEMERYNEEVKKVGTEVGATDIIPMPSREALDKAEATWKAYADTVDTMEKARELNASGDVAAATALLDDYYYSFVDTTSAAYEFREQLKGSHEELKNLLGASLSAFEITVKENGLGTYSASAEKTIEEIAQALREAGYSIPDDLAQGIAEGSYSVDEVIDDLGKQIAAGLTVSIGENEDTIYHAGATMAISLATGYTDYTEINSPSRLFMRYGQYTADGLISGLKSRESRVREVAARIANIASKAMKSALKINSPSKLTRTYGQFFSEGLERGMLDRIRDVQNVSARLAASAAMPIANTSSSSFNVYNTNNFNTTAARDGTALVRQINRDLGAMYYKR